MKVIISQAATLPSKSGGRQGQIGEVKHFNYLDALRGVAILSMVLVHGGGLPHTYAPGIAFPGEYAALQGQYGVQLFYMLSAFTLMLSHDSRRQEEHATLNFYLRRFFRIAPLFYFVVLLNFFYSHLFGRPVPLFHVGLAFLFLHGWRPEAINTVVVGGWSIAVEMTFYMILPVIRGWFKDYRWGLAGFLVTAAAMAVIDHHLAVASHDLLRNMYFTTWWFPAEFPVFLLGMATYDFWKQVVAPWKRRHSERRVRAVSALLLAGVPVVMAGALRVGHLPMYLFSGAFALLILSLALWPWGLLVNWFTELLGRVSYSMYLLHFFLLFAFDAVFAGSGAPRALLTGWLARYPAMAVPAHFLLITLVAIPIAMLSQRWIEQPGVELGRRVIARLSRTGGGSRRSVALEGGQPGG